jgi:hypothetical protein
MVTPRRRVVLACLALATIGGVSAFPPPVSLSAPRFALGAPAAQIPARLSDQAFWRLVTEFSEEGGVFQSDNFISNETTYQYVIPDLLRAVGQGGVYLGVGPDQNFTYLVAMQPRIAFIVDIRRQAMLQHLMYKALLELARDRVEFLSLLFARPRPAGLSDTTSVFGLFQAFALQLPDTVAYWRNLEAIKQRLTKGRGFALGDDDFAGIEYVYTSFYNAGPDITYSYGAGRRGTLGRGMPTYAQLMIEDDGQGRHRSYLATEENYRILRDLQLRNLVVPLVGDFSGPKALRAVGQYLKENQVIVSAIYTSNVEQYLFRGADEWRRYYASVASLPLDSTSVFIRAIFNYGGGYYARTTSTPGPRSVTLLCPVVSFVKAYHEGRIATYNDVVNCQR